MKSHILCIFTRTPLHVGAGASVGALDQPVQRERYTGYPIIPGSAIKGVIRNHFHFEEGVDFCERYFGKAEKDDSFAGALSFSEAKVLLFPLRSAAGSFAMITCCHALARLQRDTNLSFPLPEPPAIGSCIAGDLCRIGPKLVLEEYAFTATSTPDPALVEALCSKLIADPILDAARSRIVILSDEDFAFFVKSATEIRNHNKIDPIKGTVDGSGFFNEEVVPPETLFTSTVFATRRETDISAIIDPFSSESILQFGGNSTTGLGFCTVKIQPNS